MSDSLYDLFRSKCFALAYTTVIHVALEASAQNAYLENMGYVINHNIPSSWKYYMNLTGQYHQYDMDKIATINPDGHPYMRIKIAGDNQPIEVDFTKELLTGVSGDYSLAAEYSYGSNYYNELVAKYPGCETLILGILNPIDIDVALNASNGDILYCGGYYRKRISTVMKEVYGFEKREDVTIDTEFLIEEWEQDVIFELQDYIRNYLKRWEIQDFAANHEYYPAAIRIGMIGGLIPTIEKIRLKNFKQYSAHSFHVRSFIDAYGYLGQYVPYLTREQAMYLYYNIDWLATNKGKQKVLSALVDNLLTPSNVPLVAYNMAHNTWNMQANGDLNPTVEFKKEYLNLDPLTNETGITTLALVNKEANLARDNIEFVADKVSEIERNAKYAKFNALTTKVLESDYTEWDMNLFFNLEEFQVHMWIYAISRGLYQGSIFVSHPANGTRLQLTPKTAFILYVYSFFKGYYNIELEKFPPLSIRNMPKEKTYTPTGLDPFPTTEDIWLNVTSDQVTQAKVDDIVNRPLPVIKFTSTTDFYNKSLAMFEILEDRRSLAAAENDIFGNGELENVVSKFYHLMVPIDPLFSGAYSDWIAVMGFDFSTMDQTSHQTLADRLLVAGLGVSDTTQNSAAKMHNALMNILKFFLSYTVQLVAKFSSASSRNYGIKTARVTPYQINNSGEVFLGQSILTMVDAIQDSSNVWWAIIGESFLADGPVEVIGESKMPLIGLTIDNGEYFTNERTFNFLGFSMLAPDENDSLPDSNPDVLDTHGQVTATVIDAHDVLGLNLQLDLILGEVNFFDSLGLAEVTADDFNFAISIGI